MSVSPSLVACSCHDRTVETVIDKQHEALRHAVDHAAHYLSAQGPIGVFVHHNTLHAFQSEPFEQAVLHAARLFKTEPYLSEAAYQEERLRGRILDQDIDAVLQREPDAEVIPGKLNRRQLRRALLIPGVRRVNGRNIAWHLEEGDMLSAFRSDIDPIARRALASDHPSALWKACSTRLKPQPAPAPPKPIRPRDAVLARYDVDLDLTVHPPLIRLTSAYLDQGIAYWPMPLREEGLLKAARRLISQPLSIYPARLSRIGDVFRDQERRQLSAENTILEILGQLGVPESEYEEFITAELLALGGWAGMVRCLENDPTLAPHDRVRCSLLEFLALRLTYTAVALKDVTGDTTSWRQWSGRALPHDPLTQQARLYDAAQLLGLSSTALLQLPENDFTRLCQELEACNELERRRLLHLAYEVRHERQILIPLAKHCALPPIATPKDHLSAQVFVCLDEREESFRRAIEEVDPQIETYGAAGFFGCAIDYAGIDDPNGSALCPVVVKPAHEVREVPVHEHSHLHEERQKRRRAWAKLVHGSLVGSRTLVRGAFSTACLGFFSLFPLALRVLQPLGYARLIRALNDFFLPEPRTELAFMRNDEVSQNATSGLLRGFSTQEKVDRVASVLGPTGLTKGHARIVAIIGHGSTSMNNPYESAYNCGACGGRQGGPNARVFAAMANRPSVREGLRAKGIFIPDDTWFVGGYHDTCNDDVELYDLDLVPSSHIADVARLRESLDKARAIGALERTRRFETGPRGYTPEDSLRHVQERAEHLGEPRPEYGHCTNAVAIIGRRKTTRGLFLDRRAFLASYDATQDPDNRSLGAILGAAIPVCAGINLEYYFSTVDNEGYGSGTKLPHNITSLIGVMNGFQSDLRTGLPLQTVEIHEPVRALFVVETTPERVMATIKANPLLTEFLENRWIRLATLIPDTNRIEIYRDGVFEPLEGDEEPLPIAASSIAYCHGKTEHLPLARIDPRWAHSV